MHRANFVGQEVKTYLPGFNKVSREEERGSGGMSNWASRRARWWCYSSHLQGDKVECPVRPDRIPKLRKGELDVLEAAAFSSARSPLKPLAIRR